MAASRMLLHRESAAQKHPRAALVEDFIERNGVTLMNAARRFSASATDADDAYQRTLEVLLTKAPEGDDGRVLAWALTVVKNEALMEHRRASHIAAESYEDYSAELSDGVDVTHERIADVERFGQGREALKRIKVDQLRCLLLRADGLDYDEIIDATGFSYAKVNRCLSEGRKAFRDRVARLDSGAECRRLDGVLSMMADGQANESARADAELHLRNCLHCQATLREYSVAPDRAAALLPVGFLSLDAIDKIGATPPGLSRRIGDAFESAYAWVQERTASLVGPAHQGGEMALAKKVTVVAAVSASLVAGGVTADKIVNNDGGKGSESVAATPRQTTAPLTTAPPHSRRSQHERDRSASRSANRRNAKPATDADVLGKQAGTHVESSGATSSDVPGTSVDDGQSFDAPSTDSPAAPASGGSSKQTSELAP